MFTGQRVRVILNPASGAERGQQIADALGTRIRAAGATELDLRFTGSAADAVDWAASAAADGFSLVLAAGGDGTVTRVAHGVRSSGSDTVIGVVPLGTGNGLARILQIPVDPLAAVEALQRGRVVPLDVIDVPSHDATSLLFLGAGLDAEINRDADPDHKARLGLLAYVQAALNNLSGRLNHEVTLTMDGEERQLQAHTISVLDAPVRQRVGAELGPDAQPHDGVAEVAGRTSKRFWSVVGQVLMVVDRNASRPVLQKVRQIHADARP